MRKFAINKKTKMRKNVSLMLTFLLLLCTSVVLSQSGTVTGTVSDISGEPLIGVNVSVKGTTNGTITDIDGKFTLQGVSSQSVLVFSYIGFISQEVVSRNQTNIPVVLREDVQGLEEVVVTGYSTQRKRDLTGAVAVVKIDEIENVVSSNVMQNLKGQVPGLFVTSNGDPLGDPTVRVRGVSTLSNSNPLYIIDGVPTTSNMNTLSSVDIESIQVLKDASAATIYGSRASNGVIIITTKKAAAGMQTSSVRFRSSTTVNTYTKKPLNWLNTYERGWVQWRAARNDGTNPETNGWPYIFDDHQDANGNWVLDNIRYPDFLDLSQTMRPADTDWVKEVLQTSVTQNYNVTVSTGGVKGRALLALDYLDNKGAVRGTYNNRLSLRVNSDYSLINNRVKIGQNLSVTQSKRSTLNVGSILNKTRQIQPIVPLHTVDGIGWGGAVGSMDDNGQNPVRMIESNKDNSTNVLRLFGDLNIEVEILKNLRFRSTLGLDYDFNFGREMTLPYKDGGRNDPLSRVQSTFNRSSSLTWHNTLIYSQTIGFHNFDITLGHEQVDNQSDRQAYMRDDYDSLDPEYMYIYAGGSAIVLAPGNNTNRATQSRLLSYFGKINYSFNERYLASFTLRRDGSSRFGANHRFATFPAFSLGWRLSEEDFFKNAIPSVSNLKLRYGWGMTGNQAGIGDYAAQGLYSTSYFSSWLNSGGSGTQFDTSTAYDITGADTGTRPMGFRRTQMPNPSLKWEAQTQNNFGIDFGILDQKLTGSADYFKIVTSDILVTPPTLGVLGEGAGQTVNGATMENRGYEFLLTFRDRKGDFRYSITANMSAYKNKVTKLPNEVITQYAGNGLDKTIIGRQRSVVFGYVYDGLFRSQEEVDAHVTQTGKGVGRIRFRDISGPGATVDYTPGPDGAITVADQDFIGKTDPDFIYGLSINLQYKNWDFTMLWDGRQGCYDNVGSVKRNMENIGTSEAGGQNYGKRTLDAWTFENPNSNIPRLTLADRNSEKSRMNIYYLENTSFFKLRNMEIGYTVPKILSNKILIQNARFYLLGANLLKFYKKSGIQGFTGADPETPGTAYPIPLSFTLGLNVTF